jgi:hypothetical protein
MTEQTAAERYHTFEQFSSALPQPFSGFSLQKFLNLGRRKESPLRYISGPDGTRYWAESDLVAYARSWLFRHAPALADSFAAALAALPANT